MKKSFWEIFGTDKKILIGMIHLAGNGSNEKISRALEEISIYKKAGFNGVIIENYIGSVDDLFETLRDITTRKFNLVLGVNILGNFRGSFRTANDFLLPFIQIDSIHPADTPWEEYNQIRGRYHDICVLGGINFKYQTQEREEGLVRELKRAMPRCEAIVTAGKGTGIETPLKNLEGIRKIIGDFPLISGAGVNKNNAYATSRIVDGIIIGSYLKYYNITAKIIPERCQEIRREVDKK